MATNIKMNRSDHLYQKIIDNNLVKKLDRLSNNNIILNNNKKKLDRSNYPKILIDNRII